MVTKGNKKYVDGELEMVEKRPFGKAGGGS